MITRLFTYRHHNGLRAAVVALSCESEAAFRSSMFRDFGDSLAMSVAATDASSEADLMAADWYEAHNVGDATEMTVGRAIDCVRGALRERVAMEGAHRYVSTAQGVRVTQW